MSGMPKRKRGQRVPWRYLPASAFYAFIYFLSSRSGFPIESPFSGFDKFAHLALFAVLGMLLAWGLAPPEGGRGVRRMLAALILGAFGGALDEIHQIFVPGRNADVWDAAADVIGTAAGVILWIFLRRSRRKTLSPDKKNS